MEQSLQGNGGWNSRPWRMAAWSAAALLMLVPVGVQLAVGPFGWDGSDFVFFAIILLTGGFLFDFAARKSPSFSYLAAVGAALAAGFGLFVVNGAVGLVGSEDEAHNLWFGLVLLIAIATPFLSRGRPRGMALGMLAAAVAHIVVSAALLFDAGWVSDGNPWAELVGLSIFAAMWLASAGLFRLSAE